MANAPTAEERTMRMREVILRAVNRELTWIQAADILGFSARTMRRWKTKFELEGFEGLIDGRTRGHGSPRRVRRDELEPILRLYSTRYQGLNVRHFCSIARREHAPTQSGVAIDVWGGSTRADAPELRLRVPPPESGQIVVSKAVT